MDTFLLTYEPDYKGPLYEIMGEPKHTFKITANNEEEAKKLAKPFEDMNPDWNLVLINKESKQCLDSP